MVDEHHRYRPGEPLRRYVAWYTGYRQRGIPSARHRGLPSPYLTMIFTLDEPLSIEAHPDPGQPPGEFGTLLGGLHSAPALIRHEGAQSGIQLALKPPGVRALLGLPAGQLAGLDVPAEAVLGGVGAELRERVRGASGWPGRFAVLDEILLRQLLAGRDETGAVAPEVLWSWRQLLRPGGAVRVADLAAGTGWSTRHLATRFRAEIGLTPKAAARVVRFDRARRRLVSGRRRPRRPRQGYSWPTSRPRWATSTRLTWPGSSARWPACRRASGWPRSSETSKPGTGCMTKAEVNRSRVHQGGTSCRQHRNPRSGPRCGRTTPGP